MKPFGKVSLVGAGPGDPDLLTIRAMRAILAADVLVHDRLVGAGIIGLAPPDVPRIPVGKRAGHHPVPQDEINRMLADLAMRGQQVVRLKGGDPFIFGRGSEEAAALRRRGIRGRGDPGGSPPPRACAAPTGVPLTHRGVASGVRYVTGHRKDDAPLDLDWSSLADPDTTLVVYMGAANIAEIAYRLMEAGLSHDTPVLAVSKATMPDERRLASRLDCIGLDARATALPCPVLFVIGRVAGLAEDAAILLPEAVNRTRQTEERLHA